MTTTIKTEFKQWQSLPALTHESLEPPQGLGVQGVRGEGTHRFDPEAKPASESGVSPVPRQPPHSKTLTRARTPLEPSDVAILQQP